MQKLASHVADVKQVWEVGGCRGATCSGVVLIDAPNDWLTLVGVLEWENGEKN